jgi:hypothetical protein
VLTLRWGFKAKGWCFRAPALCRAQGDGLRRRALNDNGGLSESAGLRNERDAPSAVAPVSSLAVSLSHGLEHEPPLGGSGSRCHGLGAVVVVVT